MIRNTMLQSFSVKRSSGFYLQLASLSLVRSSWERLNFYIVSLWQDIQIDLWASRRIQNIKRNHARYVVCQRENCLFTFTFIQTADGKRRRVSKMAGKLWSRGSFPCPSRLAGCFTVLQKIKRESRNLPYFRFLRIYMFSPPARG